MYAPITYLMQITLGYKTTSYIEDIRLKMFFVATYNNNARIPPFSGNPREMTGREGGSGE